MGLSLHIGIPIGIPIGTPLAPESELCYKQAELQCNTHFLTLVVSGFPSDDTTQEINEEMLKSRLKLGGDVSNGFISVTARTK